MAHLVTRVTSVLGADAASIYLADEERLRLRGSSGARRRGRDARVRGGLRRARGRQPREPLLSHDPAADLDDPALRDLKLDSLVGVPLLAEEEVTGVLVVCTAAPRRLTPEDMGMLRLAADRVALGIDRARVFEREHKIAETLQRTLLPDRLPALPGLDVAARYLPAAAEAEVGGDWYDVIPIPGEGWGWSWATWPARAWPPRRWSGRLRSALRAYALEGHDPATALEQLNRLIWTEGPRARWPRCCTRSWTPPPARSAG